MKANKSKGYYAKTDNGYLCPVCGKTYSGAFARRDTINCCHDKKPLSDLAFRAAEQILIDSYHAANDPIYPCEVHHRRVVWFVG